MALEYATTEYPHASRGRWSQHGLPNYNRCLRPIPVDQLPVLAGIAPPALRREAATLALGRRACMSGHLLHDAMRSAKLKRVKSRNSFAHHARVLTALMQELAEHWIQARRTESWASTTTTLHQFMPTPSTIAAGADLSLRAWTKLNRLRSGIGRIGASMLLWGLVESDRCD